MLTEHGRSLEVPEEYLMDLNLITAILPHPIHGRLVEFPVLMVNKHISIEGVRYALSWRDRNLAFYQPITAH